MMDKNRQEGNFFMNLPIKMTDGGTSNPPTVVITLTPHTKPQN